MLKKILSMRVAIVLLFTFGLVIGVATFIENDYGTETARSLIYSARWFEIFLLFFTVVLIYNGYRYKSYKRAKWSILLFHFSFVMVAIGAGLTRYVGYEGIMHIREGESANKMVSDVKVLRIEARVDKNSDYLEKKLFLSSMTKNHLNESLKVGDKNVEVELIRYLPSAVEEVVSDSNGTTHKRYVSDSLKPIGGLPEMTTFKISVGDKSEEVNLFSRRGEIGRAKELEIEGVKIKIALGAKVIPLPFSLKLIDFQLERYPGSMAPSSYASEVELTDKERGIESMPYRIYMNHVLDYRNYRFFQSSYDMDEKGTVLSVNHDPGTVPTYIGYVLMIIGMVWNIFAKGSRFQKLLKRTKKLQSTSLILFIMLFLGFSSNLRASTPDLTEEQQKQIDLIDDKIVDSFSKLTVQGNGGRMKPIDTLARDIVSKISGKTYLYDISPTELILGMITKPLFYQKIPMIRISHSRVAQDLGLDKDTKFAKFSDFFDDKMRYKLADKVEKASRKKATDRNKYDTEMVKIDERLNITYMTYTGDFLRIFPIPHDKNNKWLNIKDAVKMPQFGKLVRDISEYLFVGINNGIKSGNWKDANQSIYMIRLYQHKFGKEVVLSDKMVDIEIEYNKLRIFQNLIYLYLILGFILLILSFVNVLKASFSLKRIMFLSWNILLLGFIIHVAGMGLRWYIAGHAPWSNSYEALVFISATTIMAGLFFGRKTPFVLTATSILGGVTIAVAHMSFVNPEISNLVAVLKSYWLVIHVAGIISGAGFLGLGSMISLLVLILFILRDKEKPNIENAIKELTNIAEMSLIIGLFLYTIGNFLGGVWANESWGRYWGWDSKETWAAVTILVYATVIHLRFIPKLNNPFIFNVASLWAYSSVLMTYFGVNYYLSGMHSYASGEPVPIPMWVYFAVLGILTLTLLAYRKRNVLKY